MLRKFLTTFFVLLNFVYAQNSSDDVTQQIWVDYNPQWDLNSSSTLYSSFGSRTIVPYTWTIVYVTTAIRYAPDPLFDIFNKTQQELHGGLSVFYTFNEDNPNQIELRPFQGYRISWPNLEQLKVTHFLRLEERFIFIVGESDFNFDLRARYKLEAIFHRTKHLVDFAEGMYFPVSIEFFINLYSTKDYNNAARFTPGLGYSSESDRWKIQFDLSYQYTENTDESDITKSTIIYRLRFFQAI
jgi:hypothetical protein